MMGGYADRMRQRAQALERLQLRPAGLGGGYANQDARLSGGGLPAETGAGLSPEARAAAVKALTAGDMGGAARAAWDDSGAAQTVQLLKRLFGGG